MLPRLRRVTRSPIALMAVFAWTGPIAIRPCLAADTGTAASWGVLGALGAVAAGLLLAVYLFWRRLRAAKARLAAMERRIA